MHFIRPSFSSLTPEANISDCSKEKILTSTEIYEVALDPWLLTYTVQ